MYYFSLPPSPPPTRIIKKISITPPTQVVQSAVMPLTGTSSRFYNQGTSRHSFVHHTFFERVIICQCPTGGILDVDIVVVTTYVNVHRCQEDNGRVQVLMVERPSFLKLRNKQQIHRNGSDQYIKNYYKMCHVMMEYLFNGGFAVVEEQKAKEAISINQYLRKAGRYIKALHIVLTKPSTTMLANALCEEKNDFLVHVHTTRYFNSSHVKKKKTSNQHGYLRTDHVYVVTLMLRPSHLIIDLIGKRKCILLILVDVVGVTTDVVGVTTYLNYSNYGIREWRDVLILVDVVVVTTYVNVHRCQEDDGRVQVLMVERPSSLKLRNKQQVHVCRNYGSDQYIKNYYTMCHPMMECLFNELKQSTMRKSSSRKKVLSLSRRNSSTPVTCALMPH